jgi:hypothetical protein
MDRACLTNGEKINAYRLLVGKLRGNGLLGRPNVSVYKQKKNLHGLSPRANYTDRATAAFRRSDCQLLRIEGATWSA